LLVELAHGKTLDEALAITDEDIMRALGGYPEKKKDYPERSRIALKAAIDDYRAKRAAGKITDDMLEKARAVAAGAAALAELPGTGKTSQDAAESAAPTVLSTNGIVTIKLH
jgi:hypothetical protein